jgi:hypothetical protein
MRLCGTYLACSIVLLAWLARVAPMRAAGHGDEPMVFQNAALRRAAVIIHKRWHAEKRIIGVAW